MRRVYGWIVFVLYCCPPLLGANYEKAEIVSMKTVSCDKVRALEPGANPVVNAFVGPNGASQPHNGEACTAYELRTSKVVYHVMTAKNLILPVGETVQIRLTSRDMSVHTEDSEKDVRATILEMSLAEKSAARHDVPPTAPKRTAAAHHESAQEPTMRICLSNNGDVVPCLGDR
jgi:hypothetical protein